ncbi:lytic transglycosylase domain-containing protein [Candidatus Contubernalis alkaliaceticus]|uniref:lytic transglycosylase domain-containing protein n=1 Tax=Candidatus Contubernalis alkaliaceticus TaxID=338645 RepID=UPI001F4BF3D7|nr:lytic transglycosylase domain-containing protein [Candidatus Contubernalis alkalaceticus]UNC90728.1 lytic transglycosylase domain-containing protein [Candidatus Contubernalis alkalaceticus]
MDTNYYMYLENLASANAEKFQIPRSIFLGLITLESGWNPNAGNSSGAIGLTQIIPSTAALLGYRPEELANNPELQLEAGAKYLSSMYQEFGDWKLALAAYNAGPAAVKRYNGIPPFKETQNHVKRVLEMSQTFED